MRHLFIITRQDLPPGPQAVQSTHAAIQFLMEHPEVSKEWFVASNYLRLHSVENEPALLEFARVASEKGLRISMFREPDLNHALTAIAVEPSHKSRKLCDRLPLTLR